MDILHNLDWQLLNDKNLDFEYKYNLLHHYMVTSFQLQKRFAVVSLVDYILDMYDFLKNAI